MAHYFKRIMHRNAGPVVTTTLSKGGTYPDYTISGWTPLQGSVETATMQPAAEIETPSDGGSSNIVHAEQLPTEVTLTDLTKAEYDTLRALNGAKKDILFMDPDQPDLVYIAHGVRLYVKPDIQSAAVMKVTVSGLRKYSTSLNHSPMQLVTVS